MIKKSSGDFMNNKHRNLITILVCVVMIISVSFTSAAQSLGLSQSSKPLHYMGALPDTRENIEKYILKDDTSRDVDLPSSVDNSYLYPTPMKQSQPDCVAWAIGYAQMAGMQALNRGWTVNTSAHTFSPSFLYNLSNAGSSTGIILGTGISHAIQYGACPGTYYEIRTPYNASVPSLAIEAASLYKPTSFYVTSSLTQIKQAIAEGKGVAMGIWVYPEMYSNMSETNYIYDDASGDIIDGHAVCLVGYDDSIQAFKFINSWGADWCLDGFGWISYDLVADDNVNLYGAYHGYVLRFPETDNYVMGDANLDNRVTAADAKLAKKFANGTATFTDRQYVLADVDGDGTVTAEDANNIINYSSNLLNKFPLYE